MSSETFGYTYPLEVVHRTGLGEAVTVEVTTAPGAGVEPLSVLTMLVGSFFKAADAGMFAGPDFLPRESGADPVPIYFADGNRHCWQLSYWRCDAGAWSILANLLERYSQTVFVIQGLKIQTESRALLNFAVGSALPAINPRVRFPYELDVTSRTVVIEADFAEKASAEIQRQIHDLLLLWGLLVMLGGFADRSNPPAVSGALLEGAPGIDEDAVVWPLDKVACSMDAFNALVNLFDRLDTTLIKIETLKVV